MIASALSWSWGILLGVLALTVFTLGFHVPSQMRPSGDLTIVVILAILYCFIGYGLRRETRGAIWIGLWLTGLMSLITLLSFLGEGRFALLIGCAVNLALFGLVMTGVRERRSVSAFH